MSNDGFDGDNAKLCSSIDALLALDAVGALTPHGVGAHARTLLASAASRLAGNAAPTEAKDSGCRMTGGICACRSGGSFGGCAKERGDCCTNEPARPASPAATAVPGDLPPVPRAKYLLDVYHGDGRVTQIGAHIDDDMREYGRACIASNAGAALDGSIKEQLDAMTDEQRMGLFSEYCIHCGDKNPACQCWNDE